MKLFHLALAITSLTVAPLVTANDIELNSIDIPNICIPSCQPVRDLIVICRVRNRKASYRDRNLLERQCYCLNPSFNVLTRTHDCAGCMRFENPKRGHSGNRDIDYILRVCGFNKGPAPIPGRPALPGKPGQPGKPGTFAAADNETFVPTETHPVSVQATSPSDVAQLTATVEPQILTGLKEGDVPVVLENNEVQMPVDGTISNGGTQMDETQGQAGQTNAETQAPLDSQNPSSPATAAGAGLGSGTGGLWCSTALFVGLSIFVAYL